MYRLANGIPERCDLADCRFHAAPLIWNNKPFKPILDHADGVNSNNRPNNLRYLCPLCDAQQENTRGGANKGRVEKFSDGFSVKRLDGTKAHDVEVTLSARAGLSFDAVLIRNGRIIP
jgi:hypothetical protein